MLKTSTTGFLYSILEFSMQANVGHGESCLCTALRIFATVRTLEFVQRITPKATSNSLDKAYLATMKCVVVSKAFKKVAEEQTKFKQIKRQLKAFGFDNEYAGQMADTLNNACRFSMTLRKFRVT